MLFRIKEECWLDNLFIRSHFFYRFKRITQKHYSELQKTSRANAPIQPMVFNYLSRSFRAGGIFYTILFTAVIANFNFKFPLSDNIRVIKYDNATLRITHNFLKSVMYRCGSFYELIIPPLHYSPIYKIVTEVDARHKSFVLERLLPTALYQVHITTINDEGRSNQSQTIIFDTSQGSSNDDWANAGMNCRFSSCSCVRIKGLLLICRLILTRSIVGKCPIRHTQYWICYLTAFTVENMIEMLHFRKQLNQIKRHLNELDRLSKTFPYDIFTRLSRNPPAPNTSFRLGLDTFILTPTDNYTFTFDIFHIISPYLLLMSTARSWGNYETDRRELMATVDVRKQKIENADTLIPRESLRVNCTKKFYSLQAKEVEYCIYTITIRHFYDFSSSKSAKCDIFVDLLKIRIKSIFKDALMTHLLVMALLKVIKINGTGTTKSSHGLNGTLYARGEEIGIVVVVLLLWVFVILLFFNKWGKIRMLEPYHPEYKQSHVPTCQLKGSRLTLDQMHVSMNALFERERLLSVAHVHKPARLRQNSVFVHGSINASTSAQNFSRKLKCLDKQAMGVWLTVTMTTLINQWPLYLLFIIRDYNTLIRL
uniref:Fibronectin type III domain-containing protein n=1 Tax=Strigamia maritima TaxID=126957 RepID=T1JBK1_STRMM